MLGHKQDSHKVAVGSQDTEQVMVTFSLGSPAFTNILHQALSKEVSFHGVSVDMCPHSSRGRRTHSSGIIYLSLKFETSISLA